MKHELDARRLLCPMPVIKTQEKAKQCQVGDILEIICTDPGALQDIPTWCRMYGHEVISSVDQDGEIKITIKIGPGSRGFT